MIIKTASLTPKILRVVKDQGTEAPFSGEYTDTEAAGTYLCRQCGLALFRATEKFHSSCGWPSFDAEIADNVKTRADVDGRRTEIVCVRCDAHLGHVFHGEGFTAKNTRHCVNSLSLDFVHDTAVLDSDEAIFAAGCFWGVEYYFKKLPGVVKTEVGYTGGHMVNPSYRAVCDENSGHYEAIRVVYDSAKLSYEDVAKYFFEIHDPTQVSGQGPDMGEQYLSVAFYYDESQHVVAQQLIAQLRNKNYAVATKVLPVNIFWSAEEYHQDYYAKQHKEPYCHRYQRRF